MNFSISAMMQSTAESIHYCGKSESAFRKELVSSKEPTHVGNSIQ